MKTAAAIELSERASDHAVPYEDLDHASAAAEEVWEDRLDLPEDDPRIDAAHVASYATSPDMSKELVIDVAEGLDLATHLLLDVAGNPYRSVALDSGCISPDVRSLAQAAYDERHLPSGHLDAARLGILADTLEEVGATGEIVAHLRSPGPHVRGCWAVDLILGKE